MLGRCISLVSTLGSCVLLAACAADEEESPTLELQGAQPLEQCPDQNFETCDVSKESCRKRIARIACCAFECEEPLSTPIEVIDQAEYRARILEWYEENPEEQEINEHFEDVVVALSLTSSGSFSAEQSAAHSVENVTAFYNSEEKQITLIESDSPRDDLEADATLLHEMIHALQDERRDLSSLDERTTTWDELSYLRALIEGEARLHEYRVLAGMQGLAEESVDLALATTSVRAFADEWLFEQENLYVECWSVLRYSYGLDYTRRLFERDGMEALHDEFEATPGSTHNLLAEVWDASPLSVSDVQPVEVPAPDPSMAVPVLEGSFGPWLVYVFARALELDETVARTMALAWRGDTIVVYELPSGESAGRWDLTFGNEGSATLFRTTASTLLGVTSLETEDPATVSLSILSDEIWLTPN